MSWVADAEQPVRAVIKPWLYNDDIHGPGVVSDSPIAYRL